MIDLSDVHFIAWADEVCRPIPSNFAFLLDAAFHNEWGFTQEFFTAADFRKPTNSILPVPSNEDPKR